ncbi:MAG: cytochrome b/b6 domain-containing protein [Gammaproteobacteria bacterium]
MNRYLVHVWDLPVRLFHWLLVIAIPFSWWSAEEGGVMLKYHMWCGYTIFGLVLFRLGWGFLGTRYARFADFVHGPRRMFAAFGELFDRRPLAVPGHNPLGGWMVVLMLLVLAVQVGSGLFANDDLFNEGPLYALVGKDASDRLTALHHFNFSLLSGLIVVHVAAIAWHRVRKGEHLVRAMVTGRKQLPAPATPLARVSVWRPLVLAAASAAIVAAVVKL